MRRRAAILLAALSLAGCGGGAAARLDSDRPVDVDWRRLATDADRTRLRAWRQAWIDATAKVRAATGGPAALAAEPQLFDADHTLAESAIPLGTYRCRTAKLGPRAMDMKPVAIGAWSPCTATQDGASTRFATTGVQRTEGHLFADTDARGIFLGTMVLGDESRAMHYGRDARRDMAGIVERIGERHWRLVLPYPAFESTLDVIEIAG